MNPLEELLLRLDTCAWRLDRGEFGGGAELLTLAEAAEGMVAGLSSEDRTRLHGRLARARTAAERGREGLGDRIHALRHGRRAIRAYARAAGRE